MLTSCVPYLFDSLRFVTLRYVTLRFVRCGMVQYRTYRTVPYSTVLKPHGIIQYFPYRLVWYCIEKDFALDYHSIKEGLSIHLAALYYRFILLF